MTAGPLGLLNLLETHLGLLRAAVAPADRVVQMRQCLGQALTPYRFYARSFEADELGTAATLLAWRDRWYEHGWDGRDPGGSPRLADMGAVEARAAGAVAPGVGQRLAAVMAALDVRRPQIERIDLLDPLEDFPPAWQRVLARLPVAAPPAVVPQARPGTLLHDLQHALLAAAGGERVAPLA
ncbi:MAG: PD-(D/E)XK nuclease family protein, partial [Rubrivivax sp.]|nr:PD-(D/E)XK nuclease family protein [Rubrivivax sp.]